MNKKIFLTTIYLTVFLIGYSQNEPTDCSNAIIICGDTNLELNSNGVGINDFAISGNNAPDCGFVESQSLWIRVNIAQSGTLAFTITPESNSPAEDYDFAVYGPNVSCNNLGSSIRCSSTNPPAANVSTLTGLNDTETDTSEGPGNLGNGFVSSINVLAGEEYYVLIDNFSQNGGFDLGFTGTATFPDSPENESTNTNIDLTECDVVGDTDDGMTNFDLETNTPIILGTQTNTTISYHISEEDASINNAPLASPYLSIQASQIIYIRIENTITGCFTVDTFTLTTTSGPPIISPTPLVICDTNDDGDDSNGLASFILGDKDSEILNGLDPLDFTLTYHLSQSDADAAIGNIDPIVPFENTSNPQTIYVRVEDNSSSLCISLTNFLLSVEPLPMANDTLLTQCDEFMDTTDGITLFNLEEVVNQITNNIPDRSVLFFEDLTAAQLGTPFINNTTTYQNTIPNQQLFVRVTNDINNCFRISTLDLIVSTTSANDAILILCDDDGIEDGFREFILNTADNQILQGIANPSLSIVYYETIDDALSESTPITTYINTTANTQGQDIIYARVEDNLNQCFGINQVTLFVNPLPDIEDFDEAFLCEGESIIIGADLESGNLNDFEYLWTPDGQTTENIEVTQAGTYQVTVTNTLTNCSKNRTIEVIISGPATIINPIEITDNSDNNTVTITVTGSGDYEYAILINDSNIINYQDSSTFTNVPAGNHTVFVRDKNGCTPITTQDIFVLGFPKFFTPNGDIYNETWNIIGISPETTSNAVIYIFDRYGKLLKQLNPSLDGWDGIYLGKQMPSSEYWYRYIDSASNREIVGHFSLIR